MSPLSGIPGDPLHGRTLESLVLALHERFGWEGLALRIKVRCFTYNPTVKSSLKFLRHTPWARKAVEDLFLSEVLGQKDQGPLEN